MKEEEEDEEATVNNTREQHRYIQSNSNTTTTTAMNDDDESVGGFSTGQSKGTRVEENMLVKKRADIRTRVQLVNVDCLFLFQPPPPPPPPLPPLLLPHINSSNGPHRTVDDENGTLVSLLRLINPSRSGKQAQAHTQLSCAFSADYSLFFVFFSYFGAPSPLNPP